MSDRRTFLKRGSLCLAAWLATMRWRPSWAKTVPAGSLDQALAAAIGRRRLLQAPAGELKLEVPDIAENGAIVPVTVESSLPAVDEILLLVEKNPTPLAARFRFERSMDPYASLRIKMNESCDVLAVVRSGQDYYVTRKAVKVMVGGCG
ncbi:thiosulfate oxidation carrier protein SoxY [Methyloterricola oryzae]|uniref:thiosulfate oxidation carrier protein SoxY n=1 Tax=Methyloterricola oryzae TaxID=1495050 RepID=UPI0005EAFA87|nr:thiosulfate oxidation carrier protein SoxY [Methyloterricola oryzae]